jgi:hypothetical protein
MPGARHTLFSPPFATQRILPRPIIKESWIFTANRSYNNNMNTFTADHSLQQSLAKLPGLTEVRDSAGAIIGFFAPASKQLPSPSEAAAYTQAAAQLDPDEMKRRKASNEPGQTTSQVLNRIASQG